MTNNYFQAIIFDLDGTLIDTESADFAACEMLYQELGLSLSLEHWAEIIVGRIDGYDFLFQELIRDSNDSLTPAGLRQRLRHFWKITLQELQLMPGVRPLLSGLQTAGYPLAVATASDRNWTRRWLTHFDLEPYFQAVATHVDVVHNKPAPDVYLFAAAQLGVQPERCLVFEDSAIGLQAAKAAGMTVVAVPSPVTRTLDFSQADAVQPGLDRVTLPWIEQFAGGADRG